MIVERRIAKRSLTQKGFQENKSGHHIYYHHIYQGKITGVSTHISHTKKQRDIDDNLLLLMKRELKLDTTPKDIEVLLVYKKPPPGIPSVQEPTNRLATPSLYPRLNLCSIVSVGRLSTSLAATAT